MKKYFILFLLLCSIGAVYFVFPIKSSEGRVSIVNGGFEIDKKPFYPIALNYIVSIQFEDTLFWASSCKDYNPNANFYNKTKQQAHIQLKAEMDLIKEMGFNTVRIVGIGEPSIDDENPLSSRAFNHEGKDTSIYFLKDPDYIKYFLSIEELLTIVDEAGLKAIVLLKNKPNNLRTDFLLKHFCNYFKDNKTILAIDIFNEPLYFDVPEKNKDEIFKITKEWRKIIKMYAPNTLVTIGLEGIREVFRWDPNILDVDFISYHPYQYEPEQVRNEIYWYGKYTKKPWIIGETAIPSDNDSITYKEQSLFAKNTLEQTFNCGGIGYSWWQYKDVDWHKYHANFMGLLDWNDKVVTSKGDTLFGTIKPVANEFKKYILPEKKGECKCLPNYYNYSENTVFRLKGYIYDSNNKPIEGGVVLGWNENWTHSYHTITKQDGSFELLGSYPFYHWMASATEYNTIRDELNPDTAKTINNIPTIDLGNLKVELLPFLKTEN